MKETEMAPGIPHISKKHSFANMSTRKHFPGEHKLQIVINGEIKAEKTILLQ
jgi:hypothetical protein